MLKVLFRAAFITLVTSLAFNACKQDLLTPPPPPPTFELEGTVYHLAAHDSLAPIPGTVIVVTKDQSEIARDTTDENGEYAIENLPSNTRLTVTASHYGFEPTVKMVEEDSSHTERDVDFLMREDSCNACNKVRVVVLDSLNHPISNVFVSVGRYLQGHHDYRSDSSNANGICEFENLCKGTYSIFVYKSGYVNNSRDTFDIVTVHLDSCKEVVDEVHLYNKGHQTKCNGKLILTVTDCSTHNPLPGVTITEPHFRGTTDGNGQYVAENLCPDPYSPIIEKAGYDKMQFVFTIANDGNTVVTKSICLSKHHDSCCSGISGRVFDDSTRAWIGNASVKLIQNNNVVVDSKTTDGGNFWISRICKGAYTLMVTKEGYNPKSSTIIIPDDTCISLSSEITLTRNESHDSGCCSGSYSVTVYDSTTNTPLADVIISFTRDGSQQLEWTRTDSFGRASLYGFCSGKTYTVSFAKYQPSSYQGIHRQITIDAHCSPIKETIRMKKN